MNERTITLYKQKVAKMNRAELEEIAALALYHLQVFSGSRNSLGCSVADRMPLLTEMYDEAAVFLQPHLV